MLLYAVSTVRVLSYATMQEFAVFGKNCVPSSALDVCTHPCRCVLTCNHTKMSTSSALDDTQSLPKTATPVFWSMTRNLRQHGMLCASRVTLAARQLTGHLQLWH